MAFAKKDRNISLGVYIMVILSLFLVGFIFYVVASNQKYFDPKYSLYMYLPNAQGLNRGAFITLSGLKVGVVGELKIVNEPGRRGVSIELKIDREYQDNITTSSVAQLKTLGILGDKYVDITIGKPNEPALQADAFIQSDPGIDPYEFLDDAAEMLLDLKNVLRNADSLSTLAVEGRGMLGKMMADGLSEQKFTALMNNLESVSGRLARGKGSIGKMLQDTTLYARLNHSSRNLEALLDSLNTGKGTFARLLNDTTFYSRVQSLATRTDSLLYRLQHGGGSAAMLLNDPNLYQNLIHLARSLDSLSTDLKKRPGRYVKFSLF